MHTQIPHTAPRLYYTNQDKDEHNECVYRETQGEPFILVCTDTRHKTCNKNIRIPLDTQKTVNLHHTLCLKSNIAIEICAGNHDIPDGLVNGADGIFMGATITPTIQVVWIQFNDKKIGQKTRYESQRFYKETTPKTWTPIQLVIKEFQIGKIYLNTISQKQFPI